MGIKRKNLQNSVCKPDIIAFFTNIPGEREGKHIQGVWIYSKILP